MKTGSNKLSRNDPCHCGSGRKYKKCCMRKDRAALLARRKSAASRTKRKRSRTARRAGPRTDRHGIIIKSDAQIEGIRKASQLTRSILDMVGERIAPGVTTEEINTWVHGAIEDAGARPAPLNYHGFPKSVCTSINEVVCHGIPADDVVLSEGDIINVDVTSILDGYYGDASRMYMLGEVAENARKLVETARECLDVGIAQVEPGADFGEIGYAIQRHAEEHGYSVVRDFGGHGVGIRFHEEPHVTHFGPRRRGITMKKNMVFTIEPMINEGTHKTKILSDGWTAITVDKKLSAQWEHTIAVTSDGVDILTG